MIMIDTGGNRDSRHKIFLSIKVTQRGIMGDGTMKVVGETLIGAGAGAGACKPPCRS